MSSQPSQHNPLRIVYAAGPGDVAGTYGYWRDGQDDPTQVAMTCSGMFYDLCRANGDMGYVIASNRRPARIVNKTFLIEHRPIRFLQSAAVLYHLGQVWSGLRLLVSAVRYRADAAVVVEGSTHWFMLGLFRYFGIAVIPSLHCVLWPKFRQTGRKPNWVSRTIRSLSCRFFAKTRSGILVMSSDIAAQVREVSDGKARNIVSFLPTYKASAFDGIQPCDPEQRPFRVLFAGRVETNKGVFDLLNIAKRFAAAGRSEIEFDLCGTGGALESLKQQAAAAGVQARFRCHGHCERSTMREMYSKSHVVIVPTRTDFVEGFNQVIAEAVLAGRPVITSAVCPALEYVRGAAIEVAPDDENAYGDAILSLCDNPALLTEKLAACTKFREQFLDLGNAWNANLRLLLEHVRHRGVKHSSSATAVYPSQPVA